MQRVAFKQARQSLGRASRKLRLSSAMATCQANTFLVRCQKQSLFPSLIRSSVHLWLPANAAGRRPLASPRPPMGSKEKRSWLAALLSSHCPGLRFEMEISHLDHLESPPAWLCARTVCRFQQHIWRCKVLQWCRDRLRLAASSIACPDQGFMLFVSDAQPVSRVHSCRSASATCVEGCIKACPVPDLDRGLRRTRNFAPVCLLK